MDLEQEQWNVLWATQISSRYHARRQAFFDRWSKVTSATGVIFGSAAVISVFNLSYVSAWWIGVTGAITSVASTVDLVVGTSSMARTHSDLRKKFILLESKIQGCAEPTEKLIKGWRAERLAIEMDEPPAYVALALMCYDDLARATKGVIDRAPVAWYRRLTSQWVRWDSLTQQ